MKKLGKKLSFLTKIMLVIGLLISNLSSLSVVFAYEATGDIQVSVVDDKLNVKYTGELAEEVENVNVNVYENYTYLDNSYETEKVNNYSMTSEELMALEGFELVSILSNIVFDGLYEVKVEITDTLNEVIDTVVYSENITHKDGLVLKVMDNTNNEIVAVDGVYSVLKDNSKVMVSAQVLAGGLSPMDMFIYDDAEYTASELLELTFNSEMDFAGYLYGEYTLPVEVKLLNAELEEVVYSDEVNVLYESYAENAALLNSSLNELGLNDRYQFNGDSKDGNLYVLLDSTKNNTMLELYNVLETVYGDNEVVAYAVSNSQYEDVLSAYDVANGSTLEEFLESIVLDDNVLITLVNDGLTVTYKVVVTGDINSDNTLTEEDLLGLIDQVVGNEEVNVEKSDLNKDTDVNTLDVMHLNQVIKTGVWEVELTDVEATLESKLTVSDEDIVSGDEFTVTYIVTLKDYALSGVAGLFNYDNTMLELVSVSTYEEWIGNNKDGKFLYLGNESLTGKSTLGEDGEVVVESQEYVLVTATFKALKAGESSVTLESPEYFNGLEYLVVEQDVITTNVVVNASSDNSLSSLVVGGQEIELIKDKDGEDVLEYVINVTNDVTTIDVEAIVSNVAANITSIVYPEELAEGENTVTITVTAETGDVKVYTVIVNREASPEEEVIVESVNNNYYNDYEEDKDEEVVVTPSPEVEEPEEEEKVDEESNLSRIIIIILILLVIAGLIYLIFKDDEDEDTKKANKEVNRLKKEEVDAKVEKTEKVEKVKSDSKPSTKTNTNTKSNNNTNSKTNNNSGKNKNSNNKKK